MFISKQLVTIPVQENQDLENFSNMSKAAK